MKWHSRAVPHRGRELSDAVEVCPSAVVYALVATSIEQHLRSTPCPRTLQLRSSSDLIPRQQHIKNANAVS